MDSVFVKLDRLESENLLQDVNPVVEGAPFSSATVTVLAQVLPFYPGYRFLEVADYEVHPPRRRFLIHKPGQAVPMTGSNDPIYNLNEIAPLMLSPQTVADYARFFFSHVRGRHGRFLITETVDDIQWREEPPPAARKAVGKLLAPLTVTGRADDGSYRLSACMLFKDSLFKATVTVTEGGVVSLSDEELLIEDMPVVSDNFSV